MAHSQQFSPQAFSPPMAPPSPVNAPSPNYLPPAKRQRISPQPASPYDSPSFATVSLPNNLGSPINGAQINGNHAAMPPPPGSMGPPSRPADKHTDMGEIADVLTSSGIDLKEEEARLNQAYLNPSQQPNASSFTSQGSSFGTASGGGSFNDARARFPGGSHGVAPSQPVQGRSKTEEDIAAMTKGLTERRQAERNQYHLNVPFLQTGMVERKVIEKAANNQVQIHHPPLYYPANRGSQVPVEVTGPDGSSMMSTKSHTAIGSPTAMLAEMLALLSLAAEDRVRGLVELSSTLSTNRRLHSHGTIPSDWVDLAVDERSNAMTAAPGTANSGGSASSPNPASALKRTHSAAQLDSDSHSPVTLSNHVAQALRKQAQEERIAEDARARKRAKRAADTAASGDTGRTPSASTPGPGTPGLIAPDLEKKTTKKDLRKAAEARASEAQQHAHANETARLAMGGSAFSFGGKKKTYSWMTSGSGTSTPRGFGPSRINTAVSTPGTPGSTGNASTGGASIVSVGKRFGEWREDKEKGERIQVRDLLAVLETDGKSHKVIQRAYLKMGTKPAGLDA